MDTRAAVDNDVSATSCTDTADLCGPLLRAHASLLVHGDVELGMLTHSGAQTTSEEHQDNNNHHHHDISDRSLAPAVRFLFNTLAELEAVYDELGAVQGA